MKYSDDIYFAALEKFSPRYLEALLDKINTYREFCSSKGKISKWQRSLQNYYGISSDGTKSSNMVTRGGDAGQLTMGKVNDYRNLIQHQLILITSQRPAGQAKAINSDPQSLHQARIGSLLTEYYLSQIGWEQRFVKAAEISLSNDEAFLVLEWNATSGDPIRPNEMGQMMYTGDSLLRVVCPWNMARDPYLSSPEEMKWGIYSFRMNKYDLAAKYPNQADTIIKGGTTRMLKEYAFDDYSSKDTDQITVHCLSHDPTPACPLGRNTLFTSEVVLVDTDYPYPEFNIYRMAQNDVIETSFGYTNNNDLLAMEEVTDALHSVVMTNQTAFGAQAIIGAKGLGLNHTQLANGLSYFEVDPALFDKLKPLNMTATAPEIFNYIEVLNRKKETLAGINSVVRGDPEGALRSNSGSALALVQAQSLQFNSGGQRAYYHALSRVNTGHIKLLQRYADSDRVIRITGKVQGQYLEEFRYNKDTLQQVSAVVFEMVDPAFQSIGGKISIADNLLQKNMIKNARQYINVVRTGSLDSFTEDDEADELAYKSENQALRDGKLVRVIAVENHEEHIASHMSVIASPVAKQDEELVARTLEHIQEHADMWQQLSMSNPALLIATKQKVLPPAPLPGGNGNPPLQAASGGAGGAEANLPQMMGNEPALETQAGTVNLPNMPINPATGERAPQPTAA